MINFEYSRAADIADAVRQLAADPSAKLIAGGTNLIDLMKVDVERPAHIIDISRLPLTRVEETQEGGTSAETRPGAGDPKISVDRARNLRRNSACQDLKICSDIINLAVAVQAVRCELVSAREFPVRREETGNFSKNRRFRAINVAKTRRVQCVTDEIP